MQSFFEYIATKAQKLEEALAKGEVWGIIDGKYVPCDATSMVVLRGPYKGKVAKQPTKTSSLPPDQSWKKVGNDWVIVAKDGKVVGGKKEFIGMKVVNGKFEPSQQPQKYRGTYSRYNYRPRYSGTIRYQNKDGVPGVWYVRPDGTEREWDEPIE